MWLCKQVLAVRKTTSNIKVLVKLGRLACTMYIETQTFKYLESLLFLGEKTYLRKAINEEIKIANSWLIANLKYILDSYWLSNLMINIFKVAEGDISKKDYKSKHNFFQKRAKDCFLQENVFPYSFEKMNIFARPI